MKCGVALFSRRAAQVLLLVVSAAGRDFERYLESVSEVTDFETYVGTASPVDFKA